MSEEAHNGRAIEHCRSSKVKRHDHKVTQRSDYRNMQKLQVRISTRPVDDIGNYKRESKTQRSTELKGQVDVYAIHC